MFSSVMVLFALALHQTAGAQSRPMPAVKWQGIAVFQIEACWVPFKDGGASTDWGAQIVTYRARVNGDGLIVDLRRTKDSAFSGYVDLAAFESCVKRWQFVQAGTYDVSLFGGSANPTWEIVVMQTTERQFRLAIPRCVGRVK